MKKNRIRHLLVTLTLLLGLMVPGAAAEDGAEEAVRILSAGTIINEPELCITESVPLLGSSAPDAPEGTYVSLEEAQLALRDYMTERRKTVTLYIQGDSQPGISKDLIEPACSEDLAETPWQGDYLRWSWKNLAFETSETEEGYIVSLEIRYYTTLEEEQELAKTLAETVDAWKISGKSAFEQHSAIYDYLVENVVYDSEALERTENGTGSREDELIYSAYGALCRGRAVCQGYATLYYAACRYLGLPVRVITGNYHAWNIVELDGLWYYVDTTWGSIYQTKNQNFLAGSGDFPGHYPSGEYLTEAFKLAYPVSDSSYQARQPDPAPVFTDVIPGSFYADAAAYMSSHHYVRGISDTEFGPEITMNRGMLVTVLHRIQGEQAAGKPADFSDVPEGQFYTGAVAWAAENGIVNGYGNGCFGPQDPLTREQLALILYRYAQKQGYNVQNLAAIGSYHDAREISSYAVVSMRWAVGIGVINGIGDDYLAPGGEATRAQAVTVLYRFLNYYT